MIRNIVMLVCCTLILLAGQAAFSQKDLKIAHLNYTELIMSLPETDSIKALLHQEEVALENKLVAMEEELNKTILEYKKAEKDTNKYLMKIIQDQIFEVRSRMEDFRNNAVEKLQAKSVELMTPVYENIEAAIRKVATENKITYVLDASNGTLLFAAEDSWDIMDLVKKSLEDSLRTQLKIE